MSETQITDRHPVRSAEELFRRFNLDGKLYYDFTPLTDVEIGFSVKRKYEEKVRFKPNKNSKGEIVECCCIWVSINEKTEASGRLQPLTLKIRVYSEMGIVERQLDRTESRKPSLFDPLDLESHDEFNYDPDFGSIGKPDKRYTGNELFEEFFQKHIRPTRPIRGLKLRGWIWLHSNSYVVSNWMIAFLNAGLRFFTGKYLSKQYEDELEIFYDAIHDDPVKYFTRKDIQSAKGEEIKALNYNTTKPVLITGSILMLGVIVIANVTPIRNIQIKGESALWIIVPILLFWTIDTVVPIAIMYLINSLIFIKRKISFKQIKV